MATGPVEELPEMVVGDGDLELAFSAFCLAVLVLPGEDLSELPFLGVVFRFRRRG